MILIHGKVLSAVWKEQKEDSIAAQVSKPLPTCEASIIDSSLNSHYFLDTGRNMPTSNSPLRELKLLKWYNFLPCKFTNDRFMNAELRVYPTVWIFGQTTVRSNVKQTMNLKLSESK
jgi:hypothetical protein